ncbi:MAG: FeoB-associated Cys-rich membrane protein [Clostridia bacterium]|nr:FeoB-associated Cys-rich membrane protein [Clostridia bacterium]
MMATIVIGSVLFFYATVMIFKSIKSVKKSLQGEGCTSCEGNCSTCNIVKTIELD